jgi:RHS repeat-associated protein
LWLDQKMGLTSKSNSLSTDIFAGKYYEKRGTDTYKYIFAGNKRIASVSSAASGLRYFHPDHLGSINYVTDSGGSVVLHREHAPLGEVVEESATNDVNIGFTDQYTDAESGLDYFGARYYMPGVGRWASADPLFGSGHGINPKNLSSYLADPQTRELWNYVSNKPLTMKDDGGTIGLATELGTAIAPGVGTVVGALVDTAIVAVAVYDLYKASQIYNEQHNDDAAKQPTPVADTFTNNGQKIGVEGSRGNIQVGKSSDSQMVDKFIEATANGKEVSVKGYDGIMVEVPEGGRVGIRDSEGHGITIDVNVDTIKGGDFKIHINNEKGMPDLFADPTSGVSTPDLSAPAAPASTGGMPAGDASGSTGGSGGD